MDRFVPAKLRSNLDSQRKGRLIVFSCFMVILLSVAYTGLYLYLSHIPGVIICSYGALSAMVCLGLLYREANTNLAGNFFSATAFIFFTAFTLTTYGIETAIVTWILMVPLSAILMVGIRSAIFWSFMAAGLITTLVIFHYYEISLPPAFDREYIPLVNYLAIIGHLLYGFVSIIGNERVKNIALKELEQSHAEIQRKQQELKRKNEEIIAVNRELEAKIAQRTQTLQLTNEELDTFLYESSHALRRPLVRILGLANIVQIASSEEERLSYLKNIEVTASGMDIMLQDLLQVSQINNRQIDRRPVRLHSFFTKVLADLKEEHGLDAPDIKLEVGRQWILDTDPYLLKVTVKVLLANALQYKRKDQSVARISIREELNAQGLHIILEDSGQGIHPRALPDIFKMFAKGTEKSKGSGLGLYIAAKAMLQVDAEIQAESEMDHWTRITLSFPPYVVDQSAPYRPNSALHQAPSKTNPEAIQ